MADLYQQIVEKLITQLNVYTQLTDTEDPNFIDPAEIWMPVRHSDWDETKRINMSGIQTEVSRVITDLINNTLVSGFYLNDGEPWADTAEVLATIDLAERTKYMIVNIMGVLYWFETDLSTLTEVIPSSSISDNSLALSKLIQFAQYTILYRRSAGTGNMEANTLTDLATDLGIDDILADILALQGQISQNVFPIYLPAAGSVAGRLSGLVEGDDYPNGWTLAPSDSVNLYITHPTTLKSGTITVYEEDSGRMAKPFVDAYTGIVSGDGTILIEGLDPHSVPLRIVLVFEYVDNGSSSVSQKTQAIATEGQQVFTGFSGLSSNSLIFYNDTLVYSGVTITSSTEFDIGFPCHAGDIITVR